MKVCSKCGVEKPADAFTAGCRQCKMCRAAYARQWRSEHPEKARRATAAYHERNKKARNEYGRLWYERNKEKAKATSGRWRRNNPELVYEANKKWRQENPGAAAAMNARRRAAKLQATPPWLTDEQREQMAAIYREARRLRDIVGGLVDVDHIVPLQGKNVSGLHVPWNLRPLDGTENRSKGNTL